MNPTIKLTLKSIAVAIEKLGPYLSGHTGVQGAAISAAGKLLGVLIDGHECSTYDETSLTERERLAVYARASLIEGLDAAGLWSPEITDERIKDLLDIFTPDNAADFSLGSNAPPLLEGAIRDVLACYEGDDYDMSRIETIVQKTMDELDREIESSTGQMTFHAYLYGKDNHRNIEVITQDINALVDKISKIERDTSEIKQLADRIDEATTRTEETVNKTDRAVSRIEDKLDTYIKSPHNPPSKKPSLISNLPSENNHFAGRKDELNSIAIALKRFKRVRIVGQGGFGKSQIAYKYARNSIDNYDFIWVVNAASVQLLETDYREFARRIGLPSANGTTEDDFKRLMSELMEWFSGNKRFLIIYDNAEGMKGDQRLQDYLPGMSDGHIVVTTRSTRTIPGLAGEIEVREFSEDDAVEFITTRLNGKVKTTISEAKSLAKKLGCLPLALEAAAAFICKNKRTIPSYLSQWEKRKHELLGQKIEVTDYKETVLTTWLVSIEQIKSEGARQFFNMCAYFASENIPLEMFIQGREVLPLPLRDIMHPDNIAEHDALLQELEEYSLMYFDRDDLGNPLLTMHHIVQEVVRLSFDEDMQWLRYGLEVASKIVTFDAHESRKLRDIITLYLSHALEIAGHVKHYLVGTKDAQIKAARIYHQAGYVFEYFGQYDKALSQHHVSRIICEQELGENHPSTATTYNNIAKIYVVQGEYITARRRLFKALRIRKKELGKYHANTATTCGNIATTYRRQGKYHKSLKWNFIALDIREKVLRENHPSTATTYNNIALVYHVQGEYPKSLEWYFKALDIYIKELGENHHLTAITLCNIAAVYDEQGKYAAALEYYLKALNIHEEELGKNHPSTATIYNNIAVFYADQGEYTTALAWFIKSYPVRLLKLGDKHSYTIDTLSGMKAAYTSANLPEPFDTWLAKQLPLTPNP